MDILPAKEPRHRLQRSHFERISSIGGMGGPITYRQNTELTIDAWHWNPEGRWSDEQNKQGYFIGSAESTGTLTKSFGYKLPSLRCGSTRSDQDRDEFSRITDGDPGSYWKSNPYLERKIFLPVNLTACIPNGW